MIIAPYFMDAYDCRGFAHYPALLTFLEYIMGAATNEEVGYDVWACRNAGKFPASHSQTLGPVFFMKEEMDVDLLWSIISEKMLEMSEGKWHSGRLPERILIASVVPKSL
jgi:hypothetical protein